MRRSFFSLIIPKGYPDNISEPVNFFGWLMQNQGHIIVFLGIAHSTALEIPRLNI